MTDATTLLARRQRSMGANAEVSYERPVRVSHGDGVWIYTTDGERLLDVYNNVPHVGHAHPHVAAAVAEQAVRIASNTRYLDDRIITYAERLTAKLPADLDTCLFVNSGSEANDVAWQIARAATGHRGALVMTHAYHGITEAAADLSPAIRREPAQHVEQLAVPTADSQTSGSNTRAAIARLAERGFKVGAFILDSGLTSSGIYDPPPDWGESIVTEVHAAGGLVIADEVQIGMGRCGSHFWGFARRGVTPDLITLGKPVGNGYPLGVLIARRPLIERFQAATGFFSTFGGNPVAAAAGLAVLEVLERERLIDNASRTGAYFADQLRKLTRVYPFLSEVRGCGLLLGVEIADQARSTGAQTARRIVNSLRDRGVLIGSEGPRANVLKLRPPMPFRPEHADIVIAALESVLPEL